MITVTVWQIIAAAFFLVRVAAVVLCVVFALGFLVAVNEADSPGEFFAGLALFVFFAAAGLIVADVVRVAA